MSHHPHYNANYQPQQPGYPHFAANQGPPGGFPPHGPWNQPPQGNQPPQQPGYPPQQPGYGPQQPGYAQQPGYPPQQSGYAPQQYQPYQYGFANEIREMKNKYGMNIPEDQIDQTIEEAKMKKRMYAFPEPETNYVRYDDKGKSYIACTHGFGFAHFDNPQFYDTKNDPNSYDGKAKHLIKVSWLNVKFKFNHVKPGNYKLFLNQSFENDKLKGQMKFKVFVTDREIFVDNQFPNDTMVKVNQLSEIYIRDIRREDFDMTKLDKNGDGVIRIEFEGNDGTSWKRGWLIDGGRLESMDQPSQPSYPPQQQGFAPQQPAYAQQQGFPPQQPGYGYQPYQPYQQYGFANEIRDMRNRYGMNIPDDQIDQTLEEAKMKRRMYAFPEPETNYVKYDERGKSYIACTHGFGFAHFDNPQFYDTKNDPNSYDGKAKHLIKLSWLNVKFKFNHVKPGNYKLFLNQSFENDKLKAK